jgi:hypothetical protein
MVMPKDTLNAFIANLRYAIKNNQTVSIGGGDYSPNELKEILFFLNQIEG